ncbi:MAG: ester cyclase [Chloroflexaceae bacterium]|jgi:steroid delta-isomerase-like uncharacterized protein|nr:ester cyclase [Chloroflexaceae bacterium]
MAHDIARIVQQLLDAWNAHDGERAASFYTDDYEGIDVGQATPQRGASERIRILNSYVRAFPDLHFTGDVLVEGQRAVLVWVMRGTHQGHFMHIPPTGQPVEVKGVSVLTFRGDKIARGLNVWDTAGFLRTVGLLPEL